MENMNQTQSNDKSAGCPCMNMNKKYAEGFKYDEKKMKADRGNQSDDEYDVLEIEEDEFE